MAQAVPDPTPKADDPTPVPHQEHLSRADAWAWLPVLLCLVGVAAPWMAHEHLLGGPRLLLPVLNGLFSTSVCLLVAFLAGRSVLAGGQPSVLLLGVGALTFGLASAISGLAVPGGRYDMAVAIYNIGVCLAGGCNLLAGLRLILPTQWPNLRSPGLALAAAYGSVVLVMAVLTWLAPTPWIPTFFIQGEGPTTLRQVVLGTAIGEFLLAALLLQIVRRQNRSGFLHWYSLGLALIAIGLLGLVGMRHTDSFATWAGRGTQYVGGMYLLVAAVIAMRGSRRWMIPLEVLRETHSRYMSLVEHSPDAILVHADGRYIFANPAAARLFGAASPAALLGRDVLGLVHPDFRDLVAQRMRATTEEHQATPLVEVKVLRLDGQPVDIEAVGVWVEYEGQPAVQVVMRDITERKRAEKALRESEERYRRLVDTATEGLCLVGNDHRLIETNQRLAQMLGVTKDEIVGRHVREFMAPAEYLDFAQRAENRRPAARQSYERQLLCKDGTTLSVLVSAAPVLNDSGEVIGLFGMLTDITARKQAEEALRQSEERLQILSEAAFEGIAITENGVIIDANRQLATMHGYSLEEILGQPVNLLLHPDDVERALANTVSGTHRIAEYRDRKKDGTEITVEGRGQPAVWRGRRVRITVLRDITARKKSEEALREHQRQLALAMDAGQLVPWEIDLVGGEVKHSPQLFELFGLDPKDTFRAREQWRTLVHEDDRPKIFQSVEAAKAGKEHHIEYRIQHPDGTIHWHESHGITIADAQGRHVRLVGYARDITDRKRAEGALRESEERLHLTLEAGSMGTFEIDLATGQARWNATEFALLGLQPGDAPPGVETFFRFVHSDDIEALRAQWAKATRTGTFDAEFRIVHLDGQERWIAGRGRFLAANGSSSGGQPARFLGVNFDITERKRAEESLRTSEARLRLATEAARMFTWECDVPAQTIRWSENAAEVIGCRPGELPEEMAGSHFFVAPEDSLRVRQEFGEILRRGQSTYTLEFRGQGVGEATRYWLAQGRVLYGTDGNPLRIVGVTQDISGRKQVEETLRVSDRRYSALFANKINGVAHCRVITDEQGRPVDYWVLQVNEAYEQIIGIRKEDIEGRRVTEVFPDIRNYAFDYIGVYGKVALEGGEIQFEEFFEATGQYLSIYAYSPLPGEFAAIFTDVTERKRAEEALRQATAEAHRRAAEAEEGRQILQAMMEHIPMGITIADAPDVRIRMVSRYGRELTARPRDQIEGIAVEQHTQQWGIFHADGVTPTTNEELPLTRATQKGELVKEEVFVIVRPDGTSVPILCTAAPIRDAQGHTTGGVIGWQDITERKRAEEELRRSRQRLAWVLDTTGVGLWLNELPLGQLNWDNRTRELFFVPPGVEPTVEMFWDRVHPDDHEATRRAVEAAVRNRALYAIDHRVVNPATGEIRWIRSAGQATYAADGAPIHFDGINYDITDRKRAEQQLQELNETLEKRVAERTAVAEVRAEQLRMLAQELTQAEQRERQRIAHILHEHFQQLLVGAKFSLSMVQVQDAASRESLQRTDQVLAEAVEASRSLAVELSPPILHYGGLAPALGWLGQWMHEKHGLKVEVVAEPHVLLPAEDVQVLLFQAVRELLFNVVKHAKVDQAKVELKQEPGRVLRLSVSDKGAGFQTDRFVAKTCTPGGFGLFSIRERLGFLDGRMEIQSAPGTGTCISLLVPLPPETLTNAPAGAAAGRPATASVETEDGAAGPPTASDAKIRVLIADDHAVVRDGLSRLLQTLPDMEVVEKATDGREAVEMALQLRPDVVIMDVSMPEMSGIEATRCILADLPATRIIGLSMHKDQDVADQMRQAGAVDYLAKSGPTDGLVAAVRQHAAKAAPGRYV